VEDFHPALQQKDVLVADRVFCSFAHLPLLNRRGVDGVFRIHQRQIVDFAPNRAHAQSGAKSSRKGLSRSRWVRQLGPFDQIVEWLKLQSKPEWMSVADYAALPDVLFFLVLS